MFSSSHGGKKIKLKLKAFSDETLSNPLSMFYWRKSQETHDVDGLGREGRGNEGDDDERKIGNYNVSRSM